MIRAAAALVGVVTVVSACAYYNTIYNAQRTYDEADQYRRAGRDSVAEAAYRDVIRRTANAYRGRSSGEQAGQILFLLGRARLRVGELRPARAALEEAAAVSDGTGIRPEILAYLAIVLARMGDEAAALGMANQALAGGLEGRSLAEAYLIRGTLLLSEGRSDAGWADLDRVAEADGWLEAEAAFEGLRWSIRRRDRERTRLALARILAVTSAGELSDSVVALVGAASALWGASAAAALLAAADSSTWGQPARGRIRLERARLLRRAGAPLLASEQAWRVASGRGAAAAEARLLLARWHLSGSRDLGEAHEVVPILLPAGENEQVTELLGAMTALDRYSGMGLEHPLSWFVAAEVARDRLGAPVVARGLFMAYADTDPSHPWASKALLAALDVSPDEEDRAWLRGRLEEHRHSPYVLAAFGGTADGLEELEAELQVRLREIRAR